MTGTKSIESLIKYHTSIQKYEEKLLDRLDNKNSILRKRLRLVMKEQLKKKLKPLVLQNKEIACQVLNDKLMKLVDYHVTFENRYYILNEDARKEDFLIQFRKLFFEVFGEDVENIPFKLAVKMVTIMRYVLYKEQVDIRMKLMNKYPDKFMKFNKKVFFIK